MLRPYQSTLNREIEASWQLGNQNVIGVMPTGAGKTVCMAHILSKRHAPQIAIAHRQELVGQISLALARQKLQHRIIAPAATISFIVAQHHEEFGGTSVHAGAPIAVAGVDTLIKRTSELDTFLKRCSLWVIDEAHHLLTENKWGRAVNLMPRSLGLGLTATPLRSDRKSLKRDAGGVFDDMIIGPSMRELIDAGFLCDYRIFAPKGDLDLSDVKVTAQGDYNAAQLHMATEKSRIVGDVVQNYLRFAAGKTGVCFAVDHLLGHQHVAAFNSAGVPTAFLGDKTPQRERVEIMRALRRQDLKMIVNQDIVGEGLDVPCIEVCIMARATMSYGLFVQMFGRMLRLLLGKTHGILIDHVGNVARHGLPDRPRHWSLDVPPRAARDPDEVPIRQCPAPACFRVFEGYGMTCPYCGHRPPPGVVSSPEQVEGDLTEVPPEVLEALRKRADEVTPPPRSLAPGIRMKISAQQLERINQQTELREAMAFWAGVQAAAGMSDSSAYRKFYRKFGIDVATAKTLNTAETVKLLELVRNATWHDYGSSTTRAA